MIKIQIPATSANLGAGFDALGLALTYYNYIEMEECDKIDITAADGLDIPTDERNLIYISAKDLFAVCGKKLEGTKAHTDKQYSYGEGTWLVFCLHNRRTCGSEQNAWRSPHEGRSC